MDNLNTNQAAKAQTAPRHSRVPALVGAGIGFVAFLIIGAVPSLLYGGYAGLVLGNALFAADGRPTLGVSIVAGGGMLLGVVAVLSLFLVLGAAIGTLFGVPVARKLEQPKAQEAAKPVL